MEFNEYQKKAQEFSFHLGKDIVYPTLGLAGETGEFVEMVKKMIRDDGGKLTEERKQLMIKELGDILWYMADIATLMNISMDEIPKLNLEKLKNRLERGTSRGSGNER